MERDDFDAALDGLSNEPRGDLTQSPVPGQNPGAQSSAPAASIGRNGQPKVESPKRGGAVGPWAGRATFDDLFVAEAAAPLGHGGLEEKVEYFRESIKRLEQQAARFHKAWQTRDSEVDTLESLLQQTHNAAQAQQESLTRVQAELIDVTGQLAQAASAHTALRDEMRLQQTQSEAEQSTLRQQILSLEERYTQAQATHAATQAALGAQLEQVGQALEVRLQERGAELSQSGNLVASTQQELATLQDLCDTRDRALTNLQRDQIMQAELKRDLEQKLAARDAEVQEKETQLQATREAVQIEQSMVAERDAQLLQLNGEQQNLHLQVDGLTQQLVERDGQLFALQVERQAVGERVAGLELDLHARAAHLAEIQAQQAAIEAQATQQAQALAAGHEQNVLLRGELEQLQIILATAQQDLTDTDAQAREQVSELQRHLAGRNATIEQLQLAVEADRGRLSQMQERLGEAEAQVAAAACRVEDERSRMNNLLGKAKVALEEARCIMDNESR